MTGIIKEAHGMYVLAWKLVTSRRSFGTNIFEKEWDHLIILDACRTDAIIEVSPEYDFLNDIDTIWSVGSTSKEWVESTFCEPYLKEINNTAYITANPYGNVLTNDRGKFDYPETEDTYVDSLSVLHKFIKDKSVSFEDLAHLEPLWVQEEERPDGADTAPLPERVTDHTIKASRTGDFDRIISHYMQPHQPYFSTSNKFSELTKLEKNPISHIKSGEFQTVWEAYLDNLRFVLDDVEILLQNIDGEVVITADHGEMMGEMGLYAHPTGHLHPKLRKVPWVRTDTHDIETKHPDVELEGVNKNTKASMEQLEALGYR